MKILFRNSLPFLMMIGSFLVIHHASAQRFRPPVVPDPGLFQLKLRLGTPIVNGSNCPTRSISAKVSDDNQSIEIRFPSFTFMTSPGQEFARGYCDLILPLKIPAGASFEVISLEYNGNTYLPEEGTYSFLNARYTLKDLADARWEGPSFNGPYKGFFRGNTANVRSESTPCGGESRLNVQVSLDVGKNQPIAGDEPWISLDNGENGPGIRLILKRRQC